MMRAGARPLGGYTSTLWLTVGLNCFAYVLSPKVVVSRPSLDNNNNKFAS
jgi:hypothetical protein